MDYENKPDGYYNDDREEMLYFLPKDAKKVLDVGCGNGIFTASIKKANDAEVWRIELMDDEILKVKNILDKSFAGPCEDHIDSLPDNYFDAIYFNDILEHLVDPYDVLRELRVSCLVMVL